MLTTYLDSRCLMILCLVLLHIILLSIPMMIGIYTMVTYFDITHNTAIAISVTVIAVIIQYAFINITSSVRLYDNMTKRVRITG
jgi:hypothetical protein